DRTKMAGLEKQLGGLNLVSTDYNNDGWPDVFVLCGGWEFPMRKSLFRNKGDGKFEDVAVKASVARTAFTKGAAWADYDNDGYPDLYVSNFGEPNFLYRNQGNG